MFTVKQIANHIEFIDDLRMNAHTYATYDPMWLKNKSSQNFCVNIPIVINKN